MGKQVFTNNASALVTSNITTGSLSFTIESGFADRFPALVAGDWFVGTLQNSAGDIEIIRVNKRDVGSNAIQNVVRGQEGTSPLAFSAGEAVFAVRATAAHHQALSDHLIDPDDAHAASAVSFSPTSDIEATTAQGAIEEAYAKLTSAIALASGLLGSSKVSVTDLVKQTHTLFTSSGTAPDFTVTVPTGFDAYAFQRLQVKMHAAGTTDSSTINVSGLGAKGIKRYSPSGAKIPCRFAANQILDMMYDGADFIVLNPAMVQEAPGDIAFTFTPTQSPGTRRLLVQGQCIEIALYPTLAFLWCGSTNNNNAIDSLKADFFYKCADPLNPSATRADLGAYLKLPDPGYFLRALNTGTAGLDANRLPFKYQDQQLMDHTHTSPISALDGPSLDAANGRGGGIDGHFRTDAINLATDVPGTIGKELRVKNMGAYVWMAY